MKSKFHYVAVLLHGDEIKQIDDHGSSVSLNLTYSLVNNNIEVISTVWKNYHHSINSKLPENRGDYNLSDIYLLHYSAKHSVYRAA